MLATHQRFKRAARAAAGSWRDRMVDAIGGRARRRAVLILAAVLSLSSADGGTIGALAAQLEKAFHIGNTQIGLLATISALVGAVASLPMGVLADRMSRTRVLAFAIALWSVAMVATGLSVSFLMLVLTRLALGVVTAVAGPNVASLVGDFFPSNERSRIYGFVLTGELLGAGAGLIVAGDIGAAVDWRYSFFFLAVPALVLAWVVHRFLPEPARGGQSWLRRDAHDFDVTVDRPAPGDGERAGGDPAGSGMADGDQPGGTPHDQDAAASEIRRLTRKSHDVEPDEPLVLRRDAAQMSAWAAARYVLRVPSNQILIAASALGYFFFAGLKTFGVLFSESHFGLSEGVVSSLVVVIGAGSVVGTLAGGRLADRFIRTGRLDGRMLTAGAAFVATAVLILPGMISSVVFISLPFFIAGAALLGATNPALDAARLDIMPSRLWGRAESVRTFVRALLEAFAPLLFGFLSSLLGGGNSGGFGGGVNSKHAHVTAAQGRGLEYTFIIMLVPLAASGVLLLRRRRRYLRDVATADRSERREATLGA